MTLYYHRFTGSLAAGDQFNYGWHSNSVRSLALAQLSAVAWNNALWNGASAGNGLKDHVTAGVSMLTVTTVAIDPATGKQTARADSSQVIPGVAAGSALPGDVSAVVSLRTDLPQRAGRGRFYLPQPAASQLTATGLMLVDFQNDLIDSLQAAWTGYNTASDRPSLYGRISHVIRPIVQFDVSNIYGCQRRRENKVTPTRAFGTMP